MSTVRDIIKKKKKQKGGSVSNGVGGYSGGISAS